MSGAVRGACSLPLVLPPGPPAPVLSSCRQPFPASSCRCACLYFGPELPTRRLCFSLPLGTRYACAGSNSRKKPLVRQSSRPLCGELLGWGEMSILYFVCIYFFNICELGYCLCPAKHPSCSQSPPPPQTGGKCNVAFPSGPVPCAFHVPRVPAVPGHMSWGFPWPRWLLCWAQFSVGQAIWGTQGLEHCPEVRLRGAGLESNKRVCVPSPAGPGLGEGMGPQPQAVMT